MTGVEAVRPAPVFAELILPSGALAIQAKETLEFGTAADNRSVIIEFRVEDADAEYERLKPLVSEWVSPMRTARGSIPARPPTCSSGLSRRHPEPAEEAAEAAAKPVPRNPAV
ncbi:glyoxalase [Streptomyces sp. NBRC 110611]|nr:hypothetical protein [Streptomyces sp. NBRC 110611]GAU66380.1 glyoxalase [Streptomyces sp. NBRC 110611]